MQLNFIHLFHDVKDLCAFGQTGMLYVFGVYLFILSDMYVSWFFSHGLMCDCLDIHHSSDYHLVGNMCNDFFWYSYT